MKYRAKVFLIFVTIAILPLVAVTMFAYNRYVLTTSQRIDEVSQNLFDNAYDTTTGVLDSISQAAGLFTFYSDGDFSIVNNLKKFSDPNKGYDIYEAFKANQNIKFVCQNVLYSHEEIYGLYVFTPSGAVLSRRSGNNGDIELGYDPTTKSWYKETLKLDGGLYVSYVGDHDMFIGGKRSVFFAQSLHDAYTHEFLGVLVIDCNPSMFNLDIVNTLPDITMLTIDSSRTGSVLYTNLDSLPDDFTDTRTKIIQKELGAGSLRVTAIFDYDTLFREFNVTGILVVIVACGCICGILLLAYTTTKNLVQPIEHLSHKMAAHRGHSLELTGRYLNRTDEVGVLYNEYNSMVEELNKSVKRDYEDKLMILDAQMKALEARINSHFLFNTLESINSMAELADNEPIATMSMALGNMFRYTIKTESELVTIEQELSHVDDYISIQSIRFDNKFRLLVECEPALRQEKVLKLILQPLVENALYHGLDYCVRGSTITIQVHKSENCLYIDVRDDGQGMDPEQVRRLNGSLREEAAFTELGHRTKRSIGLANIHSRIELYYGRGYGLTVSSSLGEWTNIRIKLPVIS